MENSFRFLSFGAGVQTTALMLLEDFDEVVFADTGAEKRQTYEYIERFVKPYLAVKGVPFTVVSKGETLTAYCIRTRNIPSIKYRWSTRDFKIRPMQKYFRKSGHKLPVRCAIGISTDEIERAKIGRNLPEWTVEYPLIDRNVSRKDCERIILQHGWPLPLKSGCFICPFQTDSSWRDIYLLNPEEWKSAVEVEKNARLRRPTISFNGGDEPLEEMAQKFDGRLDLLLSQKPCDGGYCEIES